MGIQGKTGKTQGSLSVYVHIPFCASRCPYCDFTSTDAFISEHRYTECLAAEFSRILDAEAGLRARALESIYIGGGTPSLFSPASIGSVIRLVKEAFAPCTDCEVTVEANPESVDEGKLAGYLEAGANRLSLGVQSLDDSELAALGRIHTARRALSAFKEARRAGFSNIGVDLIFGVPGQTVESFSSSIERVAALGPEHVSVYGLTYEEGTPMTRARDAGGLSGRRPTDEQEERMFCRAESLLSERGYVHYEISNFSLPGFESRHNRRYWRGGDYIGLGAGAHSYLAVPSWGRRWWNTASVTGYMEAVERGDSARAGAEALGREQAMTESVMLGLRMLTEGLRAEEFRKRFGLLPKAALKGCAELEASGLVRSSGDDILLTHRGTLLSNEVFVRMA